MKPGLAKTKLAARAGMPDAEKAICDTLDRLRERGFLDAVKEQCKRHHVTVEEIAGKSRTKSFVSARHAVWLWLHNEQGLSWPQVGALFGRTHDTIMQSSDRRAKKAKKALEEQVAEKIAAWLDNEYPSNVDIPIMTKAIREGAWRQ